MRYPKTKAELFEIATQRVSTSAPDLLGFIRSLPKRKYRDSAEVAIALGEIKIGKRPEVLLLFPNSTKKNKPLNNLLSTLRS